MMAVIIMNLMTHSLKFYKYVKPPSLRSGRWKETLQIGGIIFAYWESVIPHSDTEYMRNTCFHTCLPYSYMQRTGIIFKVL